MYIHGRSSFTRAVLPPSSAGVRASNYSGREKNGRPTLVSATVVAGMSPVSSAISISWMESLFISSELGTACGSIIRWSSHCYASLAVGGVPSAALIAANSTENYCDCSCWENDVHKLAHDSLGVLTPKDVEESISGPELDFNVSFCKSKCS